MKEQHATISFTYSKKSQTVHTIHFPVTLKQCDELFHEINSERTSLSIQRNKTYVTRPTERDQRSNLIGIVSVKPQLETDTYFDSTRYK